MSSIPKAMKYLQVHYETLTELHQTLVGSVEKVNRLTFGTYFYYYLGYVGRHYFCSLDGLWQGKWP